MEEIDGITNLPEGKETNPLDVSFETTEEKLNSTLSKEDFEKYFEGDDFSQRNMGNCGIIISIKALANFGDYENLIRTSVKKDENGFTIGLPLGSPNPKEYFVSFDEIRKNQKNIKGEESILVKGKDGTKALVLAYGKMATGKKDEFDHNNLAGMTSDHPVFDDLVYGINVYQMNRMVMTGFRGLVLNNPEDQRFIHRLHSVLNDFNKETDMLTLTVNEIGPGVFGNFLHPNHRLCVLDVRQYNGELTVTLGDTYKDERPVHLSFSGLVECCSAFSLGTKNKKEYLENDDRIVQENSNEGKMKYQFSSSETKEIGKFAVNQVVQLKGKAKDALREARGDIIVTGGEKSIHGGELLNVSSYGFDTKLEERDGIIVVSVGTNELLIDKGLLSNKYEYEGEIIQNNNYPLYLYGAKIANFVNMMRNLYIDTKKWDKNNDTPFCLVNGTLQFDDNPKSFNFGNRIKRQGKELIGDDYIECLKDWESLGIDPSDDTTKQKIVDFLNQLVENKKASS